MLEYFLLTIFLIFILLIFLLTKMTTVPYHKWYGTVVSYQTSYQKTLWVTHLTLYILFLLVMLL